MKISDVGDVWVVMWVEMVENGDERVTRATTYAAAARRALNLDVDVDCDEDDEDEMCGVCVVLVCVWLIVGLGDDGVLFLWKVWLSMGCSSGGTILSA